VTLRHTIEGKLHAISFAPVNAEATALLLFRKAAAVPVYISGTLRTLIGADLLNPGKIPDVAASSLPKVGMVKGRGR
jgi:uncharacterized membrane protein